MQPCKLGHPRYESKSGRLKCRTCLARWRRTEWRSLRSRAITALGGRCVQCGNDDMRVLQLDHKNGDGHTVKRNGGSMRKAWVQLIRGTYDGLPLQVLCANCHAIKSLEEAWVD